MVRGLTVLLLSQLPAIAYSFQCIAPFSNRLHSTTCSTRTTCPSTTTLFDVSGGNNERDALEKDLKDTKDVIGKIDILEATIKEADEADRDEMTKMFDTVEQSVDELSSIPICPAGLSMEDYQSAIRAYAKLPLSLKLGLYTALDLKTGASPYPTIAQFPEIVSRLYETRERLTAKKLEDGVQEAQKILNVRKANAFPSGMSMMMSGQQDADTKELLTKLLDGKSVEQTQAENVVKQQLGRVTRKEGIAATANDLETLMNVMDKKLFVVRGAAEQIPGGYVVRGTNTMKTSKELMDALDSKLPTDWKAQVSLLPDITSSGLNQETGTISEEPVLVLLNKDFSPETSWILPISTTLAIITTFLYALRAYANNASMTTLLADRSALGDFSGVDIFNSHLIEVVVPLVIIQILHELGHLLIAQKDKIDISAPTLVPFFDKLPSLGVRTNLKSSPPNLTSLFDFAFIGPFMGIMTALVFFVYGIQATLTADPQTLQSFPALTVEELKLSTLGSGILDYAFGGSGVITSQDPATSISLHPFAVAGFAGLFIQSIEMLPLGSTDGGRISQAIFGRSGHLVVGGGVWIALLIATLFVDQSSDILLGAWALNNVAQNDMEIPCREEVSNVDLFRSAAGFGLWFLAILTIVPMQ